MTDPRDLQVLRPDQRNMYYFAFSYPTTEAMVAGTLVRLSADETVSQFLADGVTPVEMETEVTSARVCIGMVMENRGLRIAADTLESDPLVSVWVFGGFSASMDVEAPAGNLALGALITLGTGHKALVVKAATAGNLARILI